MTKKRKKKSREQEEDDGEEDEEEEEEGKGHEMPEYQAWTLIFDSSKEVNLSLAWIIETYNIDSIHIHSQIQMQIKNFKTIVEPK